MMANQNNFLHFPCETQSLNAALTNQTAQRPCQLTGCTLFKALPCPQVTRGTASCPLNLHGQETRAQPRSLSLCQKKKETEG